MSIQSSFPDIRPSLNLDFANSKALDPRITFVRSDSQPIARYYDGKTVAKAEENLLTYSAQFDNAVGWEKARGTVTSNYAAAPDGTVSADLLTTNAAGTYGCAYRQSMSYSGTAPYTLSVYAKAEAGSYLVVMLNETGYQGKAWFDLVAGTVGTSGAGTTANISAVGGGWYRCTVTATPSATSTGILVIGIVDADNSNNTSSGKSVGIWGAQLEQRAYTTAYTPTTSSPITNYIPTLQTAVAGVPRIDHDPVTGECKGLLIEEQRANLLTYSSDFDNAAWYKNSVTVQGNAAVAPDGSLAADKIVLSSSSGSQRINSVVTVSGSTAYTQSVYVRASGVTKVALREASLTGAYVAFDLAAGTILQSATTGSGTPIGSIVSVGNGWFRISMSLTSGGTSWGASLYLLPSSYVNGDPTAAFAGDGNSGIYIWGAQLEQGAFPTSYIKTEASQVTRAADSASMTGANFSSWYRADEGTFYSDTISFGGVLSPRALTAFGPTTAEQIAIGADVTRVRSGAVDIGAFYAMSVLTGKRAVAYAVNQQAAARDGASTSSTNSGIPSGIATLSIGATIGSAALLNGTIKRITYYPKRLTDAQLQSLTA